MEIVKYPHPTLRHKSKPIRRVDAALKEIIREMFQLMYAANGIGLAANQVDLPLRLFVVNLSGVEGEGEELVFINPVLSRSKGNDEKEEGCLSLPKIYGKVTRPAHIHVNAYNEKGEEMDADLDTLLARVVQHETDHLDGVLFTDRLSKTGSIEIETDLAILQRDYDDLRDRQKIASDAEVQTRLLEWEARYC